ncbi:hypothetical protein GGS23DRAFT_468107 [Durotheca rogersii]|uniref:uncharacterized protein n=1 Tax=Durotheca rogersii TaxID=419775 RepID=UPI00221ED4EC|nr:uncharacterized protein GGS23DRAFT_468107 [Durotheca rogersii]KAI5864896.1 hypothetical protein GGS23DRAFT_468107 [Durotheca rogersii]
MPLILITGVARLILSDLTLIHCALEACSTATAASCVHLSSNILSFLSFTVPPTPALLHPTVSTSFPAFLLSVIWTTSVFLLMLFSPAVSSDDLAV